MMEHTEIGDGIIWINKMIGAIEGNKHLTKLFNSSNIQCVIRGCRRSAMGIMQVKVVHRGKMLADGTFYLMPMCSICYELRNTNLKEHTWEIKEGYPLLRTTI